MSKTFKLGLNRKKEDPRTLKMENYLYLPSLPSPPNSADYLTEVRREISILYGNPASVLSHTKGFDIKQSPYGIYGNDQSGCCGPAGAAHQTMAITATSGTVFIPDPQQIERDYSSISGYDPRNGMNDNGVNMLDMFRYWRTNGIGGKKIRAFATINAKGPDAHAMIIQAIYLFGTVAFGIMLPKFYEPSRPEYGPRPDGSLGTDWLAPNSSFHLKMPQYAVGGLGGHYVPFMGYNESRVFGITWGYEQRMSWNAINTYVSEIMVPLSEDWFDGTKKAPNGFDIDTLEADLKGIR